MRQRQRSGWVRFCKWIKRPESWVSVVTCVGVIGTLVWTGVQFFYIDKPISERTALQLEEELKLARQRARDIESSIRVNDATTEDLKDVTKAQINEVDLRTARLKEAREIDELLDSMTPDVRISRQDATEVDEDAWVTMELTNSGARSLRITMISVAGTALGGSAGRGRPLALRRDLCDIDYLAPKSTKLCLIVVPSPEDDEYENVAFKLNVTAEIYRGGETRSAEMLKASLPAALVAQRGVRTFSYDGLWLFEY